MTDGLTIVAHALAAPFVDAGSRTWWPALVVSAMVAVAIGALRGVSATDALGVRSWWHRSTRVDVQLLVVKQSLSVLVGVPGMISATAIGVAVARGLVGLGPLFGDVPPVVVSVAYALTLFVASDLSRFLLHTALHRVPALWQFHQVHHSAEVLTPLSFHRVHPVETALYELRGVLVTGLVAGVAFALVGSDAHAAEVLGVNAIGLLLNVATGNLRHSHVWVRFGPTVERFLLSPAQHQAHHSTDATASQQNLGTWLAVWDRLLGTWSPASEAPPRAFGLPAAERNHDPHDLVSALVEPVRAVLR